MDNFFLFILLSNIIGNPLIAILLILILSGSIDKLYFGFLPDVTKIFRTNHQIKENQRILDLNPENADVAFRLGVLYFQKKKYQQALKYFENPKLQNNKNAECYYYLGMTLIHLDREAEGKEYLNEGLKLYPSVGYGIPYIYLIEQELKQPNPNQEKIEELEGRMDRFINAENLYKLGKLHLKYGSKEKATELFNKAIAEYAYCPRGLRRLHRKWVILSRIQKLFLM